MRFCPLLIAAAIVASTLAIGTAAFANSCFQDTSGRVVVLQESTAVGNGKCRATTGYISNTDFVLRGAVCGNSAGTGLRVGVEYSDPFAEIGRAHV